MVLARRDNFALATILLLLLSGFSEVLFQNNYFARFLLTLLYYHIRRTTAVAYIQLVALFLIYY